MNTTTLILQDVIKKIENRREELDRSSDLRTVVVTVRMKTGTVPMQIRATTCSVEKGDP